MRLSSLILLADRKAFFPSVATLRNLETLEAESYCEDKWFFYALETKYGRNAVEDLKRQLQLDGLTEEELTEIDLRRLAVIELCRLRAAWCWIGQSHESAAMWSIYAHAGVAVKTTWGDLTRSLPKTEDEFCGAKIRYVKDDERDLNPENSEDQELVLLRPHLAKSASYSHENEVRLVTHCHRNKHGMLVTELDAQGIVNEIRISPLIPISEADAVTTLLKTLFPRAAVRRSDLLGYRGESERVDADIDTLIREQRGAQRDSWFNAPWKNLHGMFRDL
jgi:hypothetical protein